MSKTSPLRPVWPARSSPLRPWHPMGGAGRQAVQSSMHAVSRAGHPSKNDSAASHFSDQLALAYLLLTQIRKRWPAAWTPEVTGNTEKLVHCILPESRGWSCIGSRVGHVPPGGLHRCTVANPRKQRVSRDAGGSGQHVPFLTQNRTRTGSRLRSMRGSVQAVLHEPLAETLYASQARRR